MSTDVYPVSYSFGLSPATALIVTLPTAIAVGWVEQKMVRCANRSGTTVTVFIGSTCCATHHFPGSSLHAPYELPPPLAVGKVTIKAPRHYLAGACGWPGTVLLSQLRYPQPPKLLPGPWPSSNRIPSESSGDDDWAAVLPESMKNEQASNPFHFFEKELYYVLPFLDHRFDLFWPVLQWSGQGGFDKADVEEARLQVALAHVGCKWRW